MDYFVFDKGLYYQKIPEFVIGRPGWDPWLLWYALDAGVPVVDASAAVSAVHQNHDYSYHADGEKGSGKARKLRKTIGFWQAVGKFRTLGDATFVLGKAASAEFTHAGLCCLGAACENGLVRRGFACWMQPVPCGTRSACAKRPGRVPAVFPVVK